MAAIDKFKNLKKKKEEIGIEPSLIPVEKKPFGYENPPRSEAPKQEVNPITERPPIDTSTYAGRLAKAGVPPELVRAQEGQIMEQQVRAALAASRSPLELAQMQQSQKEIQAQAQAQLLLQKAQERGVNAELLGTIGKVEEPTAKNKEFGLGSSITGIIPEVASNIGQKAAIGAGTGALAGAAVGGVGAVPGAIVGAIGGTIAGAFNIVGNLKQEEQQKTKVAYKDFTTSRTNIKAIITYAKNGGDPIEARNLYNKEIAKIYQAESNLKQLEERDWLSKAQDELTAIQNFRETQAIYDMALQNALLLNPNANYEFPQEEIITNE